MDDIFKIDTGNPYADRVTEYRLAMLPEFWALLEYFEGKGLLDRKEFLAVLNQKCRQAVASAAMARREPPEY